MKKKNNKICKLNQKEDKIWINAFGYYKDKGYSDKKADKETFKDLIKESPRLKKCKKIK
jgi:hypothetical protein